MSHSDYTDFTVANAVTIVQACLDAGQPNLIVPALLDRRSSGSVVAELTAAVALDLMPQTFHVEVVATFDRAGAK